MMRCFINKAKYVANLWFLEEQLGFIIRSKFEIFKRIQLKKKTIKMSF